MDQWGEKKINFFFSKFLSFPECRKKRKDEEEIKEIQATIHLEKVALKTVSQLNRGYKHDKQKLKMP